MYRMHTIKEVTQFHNILVPFREAHEKHLDNFRQSNEAKIVAAPFFPHTGATFFIELKNGSS